MRTSLISNTDKTGTLSNPFYRHIIADYDLEAVKDFLSLMNDFYFKVIIDSSDIKDTAERSEIRCILQMMFTKGVALRKMLDGFQYNLGEVHLNTITDHTILFTIVRTMYEALMGFELVNRIPDTEDKHTIIYNAYCAAGLYSRQKLFTEEGKERQREPLDNDRELIRQYEELIYNTELYKRLNSQDQNLIRKTIQGGNYQLIIDGNEHVHHVGWDEIRQYCALGTNNLHGMYKYLCSMAHPSYLSLMQFKDAYMLSAPEFRNLAHTAAVQAITCMSIFIMDYMLVFPDTQHSFDELDNDTKYMISLYNDIMRGASLPE